MSGEEEEAPKRTPKTGRGRRRDYPSRGGRPRLHENLESGAQDEPTGKGTEKTRVEKRQHRRDRRQDTVEEPRGRREAEGSGISTPKPQGTVKTRRTGTRRQAKERARKTTQRPGQSRKNGLGGRHGKQKSWTTPRRRERATTGR